jgi:hypothetical protein
LFSSVLLVLGLTFLVIGNRLLGGASTGLLPPWIISAKGWQGQGNRIQGGFASFRFFQNICGLSRPDNSAAVGDIEVFGRGVASRGIAAVLQLYRFQQFVRGAIVDLYFGCASINHEKLLQIGPIKHRVWLFDIARGCESICWCADRTPRPLKFFSAVRNKR